MHAYRDQYAKLFHGGQNVVLIAISADSADALASWAHDDQFPFLMASDTGAVVGRRYGAYVQRANLDNRTLYIVGPDGKIAWKAAPFREIDPTAYTDLGSAIDRIAGADSSSTH
ncbi:MAG TPA: redoxin domain-containing protein [Gemmatimonadales bacterium]|nr:redoxin domain-containing protein [Gemmatimonadales bacterium]